MIKLGCLKMLLLSLLVIKTSATTYTNWQPGQPNNYGVTFYGLVFPHISAEPALVTKITAPYDCDYDVGSCTDSGYPTGILLEPKLTIRVDAGIQLQDGPKLLQLIFDGLSSAGVSSINILPEQDLFHFNPRKVCDSNGVIPVTIFSICCPQGMLMGENYISINVAKTAADAEKYCRKNYGTSLATVLTTADNDELKTMCYKYTDTQSCWIGLHKHNGGKYIWYTGHAFTYSTWASNYPTTSNGYDCVYVMSSKDDKKWMNNKCTSLKIPFVCNHPQGKYGNNKYIAVKEARITANDAETYCIEKFGTHLGTILSLEDNNEFQQYCNSIGINQYCWIGFNDKQRENVWLWSSEFLKSYTNWQPGQPNNYGKYGQDCAAIYNGKWSDWGCATTSTAYVICDNPDGIYASNNYIQVNEPKSADDAEKYCSERYGTNLAFILNEKDNQQAQYTCEQGQVGYIRECWIGYNDKQHEGVWQFNGIHYLLSNQVYYTNWKPGQPNNWGTYGQDCAAIYNGLWSDWKCTGSGTLPFLCNSPNGAYGKYITASYHKTGDNAETFCLSTWGTHLQQDNNDLQNYCDSIGINKYCWIGLSDKLTEGNYRWNSGNTFWANGIMVNPFTNWQTAAIFTKFDNGELCHHLVINAKLHLTCDGKIFNNYFLLNFLFFSFLIQKHVF